MRRTILATLGAAVIAGLTPVGARAVPILETPNVTLPGGIPGYELSTHNSSEGFGPNLLIALFPPEPVEPPIDQQLDVAAGVLTNTNSGFSFDIFGGVSNFLGPVHPPNPCLAACVATWPPQPILPALATGLILPIFYPPTPITPPLLTNGSFHLDLMISGGSLANETYQTFDAVAGFPGFSAFEIGFDFAKEDPQPTLTFSLADGANAFALAIAPAQVPEPSSLPILGAALAAFVLTYRRHCAL
jgi:hypothetical protein